MNQRLNRWLPTMAVVAVSLMTALDLGAYAYRLQHERESEAAARFIQDRRELERQEYERHLYRVGGPVYYFVGKDGYRYAWVDDPGASAGFLSQFSARVQFAPR